MNGVLKNISQPISASLIGLKLAGREGFEPSIPDPKSGALPLGDRPSPNFSGEVHRATQNRGSIVFERFRAATFGKDLMIFSDDFLLDHSSRLIIDRMSDILIGSVFAFFA